MSPVLRPIRRGDLWIVGFDPATGHEQKVERPAVVMSSNQMDTVAIGLAFVIPGARTCRTDAAGRPLPNHFRVDPAPQNGLDATTYFMGEQLRSVSIERFVNRIGLLTAEQLYELEDITILLLDLGPK
jgi:mRNA-degrading endonuclease toxin of MazEF toxin-antitoxin module